MTVVYVCVRGRVKGKFMGFALLFYTLALDNFMQETCHHAYTQWRHVLLHPAT